MLITILLALLSFFVSFFTTVIGLGMGTILTPILLLFLDYYQVLLFVGILLLVQSITKLFVFHEKINWYIALLFGIPSIITSLFASYLVFYMPKKELLILLSLFIISYSVFLLIHPNFKIKVNKIVTIVGGLIYGFLAGFFGIKGSIRGIVFTAFNLSPTTFAGTSGFVSIMADLPRIIIYLAKETSTLVDSMFYLNLILCIPLTFLGVLLSKTIVISLPTEKFRFIIAIFLLIFGFYFLLRTLI